MDETSGSLFSYVDLEGRIPPRHPLRKIRQVVNDALASLTRISRRSTRFRKAFDPARAPDPGGPSADPVLDPLRTAVDGADGLQPDVPLVRGARDRRSGLGPHGIHQEPDRLLTTDMSRKVMAAILAHREVAPLLSDEHFSVDGTLIKAWASMKSFQPKSEATRLTMKGRAIRPPGYHP